MQTVPLINVDLIFSWVNESKSVPVEIQDFVVLIMLSMIIGELHWVQKMQKKLLVMSKCLL